MTHERSHQIGAESGERGSLGSEKVKGWLGQTLLRFSTGDPSPPKKFVYDTRHKMQIKHLIILSKIHVKMTNIYLSFIKDKDKFE